MMTTRMRKSKSKHVYALLLALALILSFALSPIFGSAKAASVPPIEHDGNIEIGYTVYPPVGGTYADTGYGTLTITSTDGITFDWLFDSDPAGTYVVTAVYVKGGNAYNEYNYGVNGSMGDTDLVSPTMPNSNIPAISHICFIFGSTTQGALQVTKIVAGEGAPNASFSITISGEGYADTQTFDYTGQEVSYTWTGLTPGSYTITEGTSGADWTAEVPVASITVVAGQTANATVTNTYTAPIPDKGSLQVTKKVLGEGAPNASFSITISGAGYSDTQTFDYTGQEVSYTWTGLTPGSYTITEGTSGAGWTAEVPAQSIIVAAGQTVNATVTNTYSSGDSDSGSEPVIAIDKAVDDHSLPQGGGEVTYTYTVTNPGALPLQDVHVSDDKIADDDIVFSSGDTDNDGLLDPSETWIFKATVEISETTTNVATATGSDEQGNPATPKYDDVTVTVSTGNSGSGDNGGSDNGDNGSDSGGDDDHTIITEEIPVAPPAAPPTPTELIAVAAPLPAVSPISLPKTGAGNALLALAGLMALGAGVITYRIKN